MSKLIFFALRFAEPCGFDSLARATKKNIHHKWMDVFLGEPTHIFLEHLLDDLFTLRDRFRELGIVIKDGNVYLPDLEEETSGLPKLYSRNMLDR